MRERLRERRGFEGVEEAEIKHDDNIAEDPVMHPN